MSTPTRQEIIDAHEALLELSGLAEELAVTEVETRQAWKYHAYILAALPPLPRPTMAEVEWDDDKHFLAEAEQSILGKVVMLGPNEDGFINFCFLSRRESKYDAAYPSTLTPTGRRYTLTVVQE